MDLNSSEIVQTVKTKFSYTICNGWALVKIGRHAPVQVYTEEEFNRNFGKNNNQYFLDKERSHRKTRYMITKEAFENYKVCDYSWSRDNGGILYKLSEAANEIVQNGDPVLITKHAGNDGYLWLDDKVYRREYHFTIHGLTEEAAKRIGEHERVLSAKRSYRGGGSGWNMTEVAFRLSDHQWRQVKKWLHEKSLYTNNYEFENKIKKFLKIKDADYMRDCYCDDDYDY